MTTRPKLRPIHKVAVVVLALGVGAYPASILAFWITDDEPVVTFGAIEITPSVVAPKETIIGKWKVNILRDCRVKINRALRDTNGTIWPDTPSYIMFDHLEPGMNKPLNLSSIVPLDAIITISIVDTIDASCNPWQWLFPLRIEMPILLTMVERSAS